MKIRIKTIKLVLVVCVSIFVVSCSMRVENNGGFPRKFTIPKNGGTMVVTGDVSCYSWQIYRIGSAFAQDEVIIDDYENGIFCIKLDWLTLEYQQFQNEIKLTAEPSYSSKKRKLMLDGSYGNEYVEIVVTQ